MKFWLGIRTEFTAISEMSLKIFLSFCIVYLCGMVLSELMIIKLKHDKL